MRRGKGRGTEVCGNVQRALDRKPKLRMAQAVTNEPGDRDGRRPMALQAQAVRGWPGAAEAEVGDEPGAEVKPCLAAGSTPSGARPRPSATQQRGLGSQDDCPSDGATAPSQWPAGARRPFRFDAVEPGRPIRSEAPAAGSTCPRQPQGTRHTGGRRLPRGGAAPLWEAMEPRGRSRPEVRKQRQPRVAPPFGTLQRWWDAGYGLLRGREQVRPALRLTVLAYPLRRVVHRSARPRLRAARGSDGLGRRVGVGAASPASRPREMRTRDGASPLTWHADVCDQCAHVGWPD